MSSQANSGDTYGVPGAGAGGGSKYKPFKEEEAKRPEFDPSLSYTLTKAPNVNFEAGQGLNSHPASSKFGADDAEYHVIQIGKTKVSSSTMYKLMVSSIAPRPVALVTTLNEDNSPNLAPISWYQMVSQDPPMVMISFGGGENRRKDNENNIKRLQEFSISSSSEPYAEALNFASVDCPPGISEYALSGLTPVKSKVIKTPRVKEAPMSMECEVEYIREICNAEGKHTTTLVLGRVRVMHLRKDTIHPETGAVDASKTLPVTRIGGLQYARTSVGYELERPKWSEIKDRADVQAALERGPKVWFENKDEVLDSYP
ncbi:uncharacterized protein UMAG_11344 [Mycosarcoma maydis]|uniref:Flavin reductase like domain-containing protein n=1 Tax=Mycosarcoma maydis TaxID=5270 RepID=A0A0D1D0A7_MYCMD|nr:uncharacterized protein UMAG_11344 [Ustilago maydis 521]KIS71918.1 hypothetical protein UMAG_11344 [Ustilago maydis 521]|eukprot:XP_011386737.1 hypothetical protein UMAG_11344 [Ustilago maydis 521]